MAGSLALAAVSMDSIMRVAMQDSTGVKLETLAELRRWPISLPFGLTFGRRWVQIVHG
jgi:hypothetical protein